MLKCVHSFFFAKKPKAPSVCKLFTIYSVCVCVFFFVSYPLRSPSFGALVFFIPLAQYLYRLIVVMIFTFSVTSTLYPRFVCNYKKIQCVWGWINYISFSFSLLQYWMTETAFGDWLYLSKCSVWDVELNCRFRSVDVNTALS